MQYTRHWAAVHSYPHMQITAVISDTNLINIRHVAHKSESNI